MNKLQKTITTGLVALPLILGSPGCKRVENQNDVEDHKIEKIERESKLRNTILSYLSQPEFSNSDFMKQITETEAELEILDFRDGTIYISIPENNYSENVLKKLTSNSNTVEFGRTHEGNFSGKKLILGDYVLNKPESYFLRFPSDNFIVDDSDVINIEYKSANYSINMDELQNFLENNSIYGGNLSVMSGTNKYGVQNIISNHGAFVAKKGEKSLERLVNSLITEEDLKERKAQKLLDFVTREIEYNHSEANSNKEVLKRPNEVLMTRGSDCSGKVILYASLLEQTEIDYRLVYIDSHISIGVEGNYPNRNELTFSLNKKNYSIAETTLKGFQIGNSKIDLRIKDIKFLQKPGEDSKIYDARTGKPMPFYN
jgi:hypothetical protein